MKKTLVFLLTIALVFVPNFKKDMQASPNGIMLKDFSSITFFVNSKQISNYQLLGDIVVLPEENFNETEALNMIRRLGFVHPSILRELIVQGVTIKLFTGTLTDEPSTIHLKGITPRGYTSKLKTWDSVPGIGGSKIVLAKIGYSNIGQGHGSLNLELHELAHSVDRYVFNLIRDDTIFQDIWRQEAGQLFSKRNYFTKYAEEYFAETFVMYYLNPKTKDKLKNKAPLTYQLFERLEKADLDTGINVATHR
ncbi:toxin [Cytobacillus sp. S13-E01]|uniref:anthrax toxin lethal factor-related metalloendopeptidase n=1 Tax=Cytobacillus sp. S13-E01 TaxID=3031326 RepID=UPI0023D86DEF|nr:toxin [Cytobacillus sp. S13-E01]MDF0725737.1 toxin [Cytobacillus sp. S13-E01]